MMDPKERKSNEEEITQVRNDQQENDSEADSRRNLQTGRGYEDEFDNETKEQDQDEDLDSSEPIN